MGNPRFYRVDTFQVIGQRIEFAESFYRKMSLQSGLLVRYFLFNKGHWVRAIHPRRYR